MDIGDHVRRHTLADGAEIFKGFRARAGGRSAFAEQLLELVPCERGHRAHPGNFLDVDGLLHADERRADPGRRADELERPLGIGLEPGEEFGR